MISYSKLDFVPDELVCCELTFDEIMYSSMESEQRYELISQFLKTMKSFKLVAINGNISNRLKLWLDDWIDQVTITTIMVDEFKAHLIHIFTVIDQSADQERLWGKARGIMLELLVTNRLALHFKYKPRRNCEAGCSIRIKGRLLEVSSSGTHNGIKTVDFSGYSSQTNTCVVSEIKASPENFTSKNLELFKLINRMLTMIGFKSKFIFISTETSILTKEKLTLLSSETDFIECYSTTFRDISTLEADCNLFVS